MADTDRPLENVPDVGPEEESVVTESPAKQSPTLTSGGDTKIRKAPKSGDKKKKKKKKKRAASPSKVKSRPKKSTADLERPLEVSGTTSITQPVNDTKDYSTPIEQSTDHTPPTSAATSPESTKKAKHDKPRTKKKKVSKKKTPKRRKHANDKSRPEIPLIVSFPSPQRPPRDRSENVEIDGTKIIELPKLDEEQEQDKRSWSPPLSGETEGPERERPQPVKPAPTTTTSADKDTVAPMVVPKSPVQIAPKNPTQRPRYPSPTRRLRRLLFHDAEVPHETSPKEEGSRWASPKRIRRLSKSNDCPPTTEKSPRWASPKRIRRLLHPILPNRTEEQQSADKMSLTEKIPLSRVSSFSDKSSAHTVVVSNVKSTREHASTLASLVTRRATSAKVTPQTPLDHEAFYEKVSFAFDLCRRRMTQDEVMEETAFLPLMNLTLDAVNLKAFKKIAHQNRDLKLIKLHFYQLQYTDPAHFEAMLDTLQKYFGATIRHVVLSFPSMQGRDIAAVTQRFVHLDELCLFGHLAENDDGQHDVFGPLLLRVKVLALPHMNTLPESVYQSLSHAQCSVESLTVKVEADFERLVEALRTGKSVRCLRLETSTKASQLSSLLAQYNELEELEVYFNVKEKADRLVVWMI